MVPGFFVVFSSKFSLLELQNIFGIGFHAGCAFLRHLIGHMSVDIQGKGSGCMAQIVPNGLDVISGSDGGHGIAVPQIVEADIRTADRGDDPLEGSVDRVGGQMLSQIVGEDQAGLHPGLPDQRPLFPLGLPVSLQEIHDRGGRCDHPRLVVLEGANT